MYENKYHDKDLSAFSFLVTGGAGFIGSNIVEYLLKYGAGRVRVLDNFSTGFRENLRDFAGLPAFELIEGDIRDMATCQNAMEGMDYLSHQAALGSVPRSITDPVTSNDVNIGGFLNVLVAARDAGVKRMIYAASSSTYGDHPGLPKVEDETGRPLSPYAVTKLVNELYADVFSRVYGFHTTGLRYFNVFGPRQNPQGPYAAVIPLFMQAALVGKTPLINGDGEQTRDFTYVENAVQANIRALLYPETLQAHEVINVAQGQRTSLNQLWELIGETAGTQLKAEYGPARQGDIRDSLANIDKAAELVGYMPRFKLKDGLKIAYEWYCRNLPLSVK